MFTKIVLHLLLCIFFSLSSNLFASNCSSGSPLVSYSRSLNSIEVILDRMQVIEAAFSALNTKISGLEKVRAQDLEMSAVFLADKCSAQILPLYMERHRILAQLVKLTVFLRNNSFLRVRTDS